MNRPIASPTQRLYAAVAACALGVGMVALAPSAEAAPGELVLVSVSEQGVKSNGQNYTPVLSADSGTVAFFSNATNLDPADTDTEFDVYVKDLVTGDVILASTSDTGVKSNNYSGNPSISADGSAVAFISYATNLDPADTDDVLDVYVKDVVTGDLTLASTSDTGVKGELDSFGPVLSADGGAVAFMSSSRNFDPADTDLTFSVYVKDLASGDIALASASDTGISANGYANFPSLSADGGTVAFFSAANNLAPADTDTSTDVYVKDLASGEITLASTSDSGVKGNRGSTEVSLSADGSVVAFLSEATNLDPPDRNLEADVYVKNLATGHITRASASDSGAIGNGPATFPVLSADGRSVVFSSFATNLDPADTEAGQDVYLKDLTSGALALVSATNSGIKGNGTSFGSGLSADGRTVALDSTAINLDPADSDALTDVYLKTPTPDEPPPTLSIGNSVVTEGNTGFRYAGLRVTLSAAGPAPIAVRFATGAGTATAGADYSIRTGTLTIPPGVTSKFIVIRIIGDQLVEPLETFAVELSDPSGATIADGVGIGAIVNDD